MVEGKLILKEGDIRFEQPERKKAGRPPFWDSSSQYESARKLSNTHGLDFKSKSIKFALRALMRLKNPNHSWATQNTVEIEDDYKIITEILESTELVGLDPIRDRIKREMGIEDLKTQPPINYHSPFELGEWVLKYCRKLFLRKKKLTRLEIVNLTKKQIKKLPDPSHRTMTKRNLLRIFDGEPVAGVLQRIAKPYVNEVGLYKSQRLILKHFKEYPWAVIEIFRSAGKTYIVLALLAYMILEYPRKSYAYICEEQGKAQTRLRAIRNIIVSPVVVHDYGYRLTSGKGKYAIKGLDSSKGFVCHRGTYIDGEEFGGMAPSLMAMSWTDKQAQGYHYHGVVFDDVWSITLQGTKDAQKKFMAWWSEFEGTLDECEWFFMLRTRKGINDLYARLDKLGIWVKLKQILVLKYPPKSSYKIEWNSTTEVYDCIVLDKEAFNTGKLYDDCFGKYWFVRDIEHPNVPKNKALLLWRHRDKLGFEREIQNNPYLPEGKLFKWDENAKFFKPYKADEKTMDQILSQYYKVSHALPRVCAVDNSFGVQDDADYNVIMVLAMYKGFYFLEYLDVGHWGTTNERAQHFAKLLRIYPTIEIWIEADLQQHMIRDLRIKLREMEIKTKLKEFISKGKGADYKIHYISQGRADLLAAKKGKIHAALETPFNAGLFYFLTTLRHIQDNQDCNLKDQMISFPDCDLWDLIDTLAMAVLVFREKKKGRYKGDMKRMIAVC